MSNVLLIGESWFIHSIHQKGFDSFTTSEYQEGGAEFCEALAASGHSVTRVAAHEIAHRVPDTVNGYDDVDVVVISDVGANTFLLGSDTFNHSRATPNKLEVLAEWVHSGGALLMVGGYMSFAGIDSKARYSQSPLADILPIVVSTTDDRVEAPQGMPTAPVGEHDILTSLPTSWPEVLGYNRFEARAESQTLATCGSDPLLVVGGHGNGRTAAFASDLAPHWAPPQFLAWAGYAPLWDSIVRWLADA